MRENVEQAIADAVDEINGQLPPDQRLETADDTVLLGPGGSLDSLALLGFLVALEQRIEARCGRTVLLVSDDLGDAEKGPYRTLGTLAAHLEALLEASLEKPLESRL